MERFREQGRRFSGRDRAAALRKVDREEVQVHDHRGVRLGRRYADLGAGVQVDDVIRDARGLAAHDVHERQQARAAFLGRVHRGEGVGGLARLRDRDHELALRHDRVAIPVLRCDLNVAGNARELFDQVLADHRRVRCGPTGHERDARQRLHELVGELHVRVEHHAPRGTIDAAKQRVRDGARLLEDLFQHEVLVAGLRGADRIEVDGALLPLHRCAALDASEADAVGRHDREISGLEKAHLTGVLEERGHVGRDEVLLLPVPHDHSTGIADARRDDGSRIGRRDERQRRGTLQAREDRKRSVLERETPLELVLEQVNDHLGVGLRRERVAGRHQRSLQLLEVLDDAVMDHGCRARAVDVRVRVLLRRTTVRRPARVPDAGRAERGVRRDDLREVVELALGAHDIERAVLLERNAG